MATEVVTKKENKVQTINGGGGRKMDRRRRRRKGITQREFPHPVKDVLSAHAVLDGLKGKARPHIEDFLKKVPEILSQVDEILSQADPEKTERDILQLVKETVPELASEIAVAFAHLLEHQLVYVEALMRIAKAEYPMTCDW